MTLSADWWRYFYVEERLVKERVAEFSRQLKKFQENLAVSEDRETVTKANTQVGRINDNLDAMLEIQSQGEPATPPPLPYQEDYTITQWLEVAHKLRTARVDLESELEDIQRNEKHLATASQNLDSLTAAYLALPAQSQKRALDGLEIMAVWSSQAIAKERLRLQRSALVIHKRQVERLAGENKFARTHLVMDEGGVERLRREIETAEKEAAAARNEYLQLDNSVSAVSLDTQENQARALLHEQQVMHAVIKSTQADLYLARKQHELQLALLLTGSKELNLSNLEDSLRQRVDEIDEMGNRVERWREASEREQSRAGKTMAAMLGGPEKQSEELIRITQQRLIEAQDTLLSLQKLEAEIKDSQWVVDRLLELVASREGGIKNWLEQGYRFLVKSLSFAGTLVTVSPFKIGGTPVTVLGLLRLLLFVSIAWAISHFVRRALTHLSERQRGISAYLYSLGRLTHYVILVIGFSIGLSTIGVDLSNFALIAGALSLGLGFGLQAIVNNFVSGLIVLFERSLRVGDFVELTSGIAGEVRAVNVRSTLITTPDMVDILVPNSEFVNGKVINWTLTDASRRIHIPFGVAYGTDKELVRKAGLEAAEHTPFTLKGRIGREPQVWLTGFGNSSLDFELVVWVIPKAVKMPNRVRAAYTWELETALSKYCIEIPFPQRDIHIRSKSLQTLMAMADAAPPTERDRD